MARPLKVNSYNLYDTSSNISDVLTDSLISYGNTSTIPTSASTGTIFLDTSSSTSSWRFNNAWQPLNSGGGGDIASGVAKPATATTGQIFIDTSDGIPYWGYNGAWNTFGADNPGAFSPKDISQLVLWFDAMDVSSTIVSGSTVTFLLDKSGYQTQKEIVGSPQIFTQTLGVSVNKRWISFIDTNSARIQFNITAGNASSAIRNVYRYGTVYIVGANNGSSSSARLFSLSDSTTSETSDQILSFGTNTTPNALSVVRGNGTTSELYNSGNPSDAANNTPFMCGVTFTTISDSSDSMMASIYINGTKRTDITGSLFASTPSAMPISYSTIGCKFGSTQYWKGYFGEALVFIDPLSDAERQKLEGYLAWKWGIQSYLPANHTYKTAAP